MILQAPVFLKCVWRFRNLCYKVILGITIMRGQLTVSGTSLPPLPVGNSFLFGRWLVFSPRTILEAPIAVHYMQITSPHHICVHCRAVTILSPTVIMSLRAESRRWRLVFARRIRFWSRWHVTLTNCERVYLHTRACSNTSKEAASSPYVRKLNVKLYNYIDYIDIK